MSVTSQMEFLFTSMYRQQNLYGIIFLCVSNKRKFSSEFFRHYLMRAKKIGEGKILGSIFMILLFHDFMFSGFSPWRDPHIASQITKKKHNCFVGSKSCNSQQTMGSIFIHKKLSWERNLFFAKGMRLKFSRK